MKIQEIELTRIKDNPFQTRLSIEKKPLNALVQSIMQRGLINPISVLKDKKDYIVISGHRRLKAFKGLKRKTIPCIVKKRKDNNELIIDLIHENLVREDLTPVEKGLSIKLLFTQIKGTKNDIDRICYIIQCSKNYERGRNRKFGYRKKGFQENDIFVVDKILREIGMAHNTAIVYLEILKLPGYIQKELSFRYNKAGKITVTQAKQLVRVKDLKFQKYLFERALYGRTNAVRIQALVNEHIKKVVEGTWKGYTKKTAGYFTGLMRMKNPIEKLDELSILCKKLSSKIRSFSVDTLIRLDETLEKEEFIISMLELKKGITLLRNNIDEKLAKKGFHEIRKPTKAFVIEVRPQSRGRNDMRFTFPMATVKEINLPLGEKTKVKLKVVSIKGIK